MYTVFLTCCKSIIIPGPILYGQQVATSNGAGVKFIGPYSWEIFRLVVFEYVQIYLVDFLLVKLLLYTNDCSGLLIRHKTNVGIVV